MTKTVEDVYAEHVTFSTSGTYPNRMAFCPIHGETPGASKPSLCIDVETGSWICFAGCGGGGMKQFLEKLGHTKHQVKDRIKNVKATKKRKVKRKPQTQFLPESILGLFDYCPVELLKAGFEEEVLQYHDIGFDTSRSRITYPVFSREGRLMAVVGRRPTSEFGKYVPYTEKELMSLGIEHCPKYDKGSVFWREDKFFLTDNCHDRREPVILVEGFKAALWLVQYGYNNVMALMGTHITDHHMRTLERLGKTVILCLDGDRPGVVSTVKNGYKINRTLKVLTCQYKGGVTQPDDLKTKEEIIELIENPITISKYKKLNKNIIEK